MVPSISLLNIYFLEIKFVWNVVISYQFYEFHEVKVCFHTIYISISQLDNEHPTIFPQATWEQLKCQTQITTKLSIGVVW